jgi:signal transduction histidine kinase
MSLGYRILLWLTLLAAGGFLLLGGIHRHIVAQGIRGIEDREAHQNMVRCLNALSQQASFLDRRAQDWATWDEMYRYAVDHSRQFEEANLGTSGLTFIGANLLLIANARGEVVSVWACDLEEEAAITISDFSHPVLTGDVRMLACPELDSHVLGVYTSERGPMILAARPIVTSDGTGPVHGTLVMGRFLDDRFTAGMAETVALPIELHGLGDRQQLSSDAFGKDGILVRAVSEDSLEGYALVRDLSGRPAAVLTAAMPRDIRKQGLSMAAWQFCSTLVLALLLAVAVVLLLGIVVLNPIGSLTRQIRAIARGDDASARVSTPAGGEIGELSAAFNHLLEATEDAQTAMKEGADRLERSNQDLQEFAFVASHDLQEPLRKIRAFGERLASACGEGLSPEGKDYLRRMLNAAQRMAVLIGDLLTFSRVATRAQPPAPVDLGTSAHEVLSDLEARVEEVGGRVEIEDLPTVDADPTQIRQLFQNLIGNSLKFHRAGEPPVVKVHAGPPRDHRGPSIWSRPPRGFCQVTVEDNGIGFDPKYADRIFGPFQRLHGRGEYEGTGIGLAVCRKIVERHGGAIVATGTPGEGAAFTFILPITHVLEEAA